LGCPTTTLRGTPIVRHVAYSREVYWYWCNTVL